ncbi:sec14p-like phosphatidylinositol transfer family protein [Trifolium pratense]|uniref:Sec14p-like phosphatidylinositol transfer family protein n=1 Tax=Trifolium pratense TaxID=57577 RepID=A0A2K3LT75_TRIPR|nr:sec14p-like phosphatidylinositol transfer family protein [Trifolium pratense]
MPLEKEQMLMDSLDRIKSVEFDLERTKRVLHAAVMKQLEITDLLENMQQSKFRGHVNTIFLNLLTAYDRIPSYKLQHHCLCELKLAKKAVLLNQKSFKCQISDKLAHSRPVVRPKEARGEGIDNSNLMSC